MKRVLVVGPGPLRPGLSPGASVHAADLADGLALAGVEPVVVDSSPASALLWPAVARRRHVAPLDLSTLARIAVVEEVDAVCAHAAGSHVVRALASSASGARPLDWLGQAPSELVARAASAPLVPRGLVVDVLVAGDGRTTRGVAAFAAGSGVLALADAGHAPIEAPAELEAIAAATSLVGLATLRICGSTLLGVDRVDTTLWSLAGRLAGLVPGAVLASLLLGEALDDALSQARARARGFARTPERDRSFLRSPTLVSGSNRDTPAIDLPVWSAPPRSVGAILTMRRAAPRSTEPPPPSTSARRRVLLVGPGASRPGHGAEADTALRLAARELSALGHETVVVTRREGTGVERDATRVHVTDDVASVVALEQPTDVLSGFGADPSAPSSYATDLGDAFLAFARASGRGEPAPDASRVHIVTVTDGARARIVGSFEDVEHAPVHEDDAAAVFPSLSASEAKLRAAEEESIRLAIASGARGVVTVRWGIGAELVSLGVTGGVTTHALSLGLVTGTDLVAEAVRVALGEAVDPAPSPMPRHVAVEEHVFPFAELGAADTRLDRGPFSTGTVLALGETAPRAYAGALAAMGIALRRPNEAVSAAILLAGGEEHASALADVGRRLFALGFDLVATSEAARWLERVRVRHRTTDDAASLVAARRVVAVVAATSAAAPAARADLRHAALAAGVPCFTTVDLVRVAVQALEQDDGGVHVRALEDWLAI